MSGFCREDPLKKLVTIVPADSLPDLSQIKQQHKLELSCKSLFDLLAQAAQAVQSLEGQPDLSKGLFNPLLSNVRQAQELAARHQAKLEKNASQTDSQKLELKAGFIETLRELGESALQATDQNNLNAVRALYRKAVKAMNAVSKISFSEELRPASS